MSRNILFVDASLVHGGAQRSLFSLITNIDRDRYTPHLLCGNDSMYGLLKQCRKKKIDAGFMSVRSWKRDANGLHHAVVDLLKARPILHRWIQKHKIDLIYANGVQSGLLCAMGSPSDIPMIFHNRDFRAPKMAFQKVAKRADKTIMVSDFILKHWQEKCPAYADKMVRVYNGFDFDLMDRLRKVMDYRENMVWDEDVFIAVLIADMVPWKRHKLFISAMARVLKKNPNAFGFIIGSARDEKGEQYEHKLLNQAEKLGITERLAFTDHVLNPFPLIDAANVVVSAAENEPFGRTIVEALFCGKPVVAAHGGGPEEIGKDSRAVTLVNPTATAIADGMLFWHESSKTARDEAAADARSVAHHYSISNHMAGIYREIDSALASS